MIKYIVISENGNGARSFRKNLEISGFIEFQKYADTNGTEEEAESKKQFYYPDLVIFDQPNLKEQDLVKLRASWPHSIIVVISKNKTLAWKAYELGFEDYLIFPFKKDIIFKSIIKIKDAFAQKKGRIENSDEKFFFIREKEMLRKLKIADITFIQAFGDYINIHTAGKRITIHFNLKYIIKRLPERHFIRIHKSFIINLNKIEKIQGNAVYLNSHHIPVGDAFRKELNKSLNILR